MAYIIPTREEAAQAIKEYRRRSAEAREKLGEREVRQGCPNFGKPLAKPNQWNENRCPWCDEGATCREAAASVGESV